MRIVITRKLMMYSLLAILIMVSMMNVSFSVGSLEVTARPDKSYYWLREIVNVHGNVTYNNEPVQEGLAAIEIGRTPSTTLSLRSVPVGAVPSEAWGVEILSLVPCDAGGNPQNNFKRGDCAYFMVTVRNNRLFPNEVLITIIIYDNDTIPLKFAFVKTTIAPEETFTFMPGLWIDDWASPGDALAYANVLTDWPRNEGYPYSPEKQATFGITELDESVYGQGFLETPLQAPNGTFEANLRLSPEPPPGHYFVYVTAYSQGRSGFTATGFMVNSTYPGSPPPRASFVYEPPKPNYGMEIEFDASSSTAEGYGDSIISYAWDFGDLLNDTGKIVRHTYSDEENYTVVLNVTDSEGLWNTTSRIIRVKTIHDVAVISIQCLDMIYSDWSVTISVIIKNEGNTPETFNVTAYYNNSVIEVLTISQLSAFEELTVTFTWDTAGIIVPANYTVKIEADMIPGDVNITNNNLIYGPILARMLGDVWYDRHIDIYDVVRVTRIYNAISAEPRWDPQADLRPDGQINIYDVVKVTGIYGTEY